MIRKHSDYKKISGSGRPLGLNRTVRLTRPFKIKHSIQIFNQVMEKGSAGNGAGEGIQYGRSERRSDDDGTGPL